MPGRENSSHPDKENADLGIKFAVLSVGKRNKTVYNTKLGKATFPETL